MEDAAGRLPIQGGHVWWKGREFEWTSDALSDAPVVYHGIEILDKPTATLPFRVNIFTLAGLCCRPVTTSLAKKPPTGPEGALKFRPSSRDLFPWFHENGEDRPTSVSFFIVIFHRNVSRMPSTKPGDSNALRPGPGMWAPERVVVMCILCLA